MAPSRRLSSLLASLLEASYPSLFLCFSSFSITVVFSKRMPRAKSARPDLPFRRRDRHVKVTSASLRTVRVAMAAPTGLSRRP